MKINFLLTYRAPFQLKAPTKLSFEDKSLIGILLSIVQHFEKCTYLLYFQEFHERMDINLNVKAKDRACLA